MIEDGFEYTRALERISAGTAELVRAGDAGEARALLENGPFHAVLLDVVFDRTAPELLVGRDQELMARFGGDRERATDHLARQQGFFIADALAPRLVETRVLMAYDFSGDPDRLEALRERLPGLEGIREGTGLDDVLARLLAD